MFKINFVDRKKKKKKKTRTGYSVSGRTKKNVQELIRDYLDELSTRPVNRIQPTKLRKVTVVENEVDHHNHTTEDDV